MGTLYVYKCPTCRYFEEWAGRDDLKIPCPQCGDTATREPCSGSPAIFGETVGKTQPGEVWRG